MKISLNVLPARASVKMPRDKLMGLTDRVMKCVDLDSAVNVIRLAAKRFPSDQSRNPSWKRMFLKLAKGLKKGEPGFPIIRVANSKLPFAHFSSLPKWSCPGARECLDFCYSFKAWRYAAPYSRQLQNTLLLKFDREPVREAFLALPKGIVFRLYVDGDFSSSDDVRFWMGLLRERPDVRAYGYSKSWKEIYEVKDEIPDNYLLNLSSGGRESIPRSEMMSLPFVRGEFLAIPIQYKPGKKYAGFKRYQDRDYHKAVRDAGRSRGLKVFSCPGKCGECAGGNHACGSRDFMGIAIGNGVH